MTLSSVRSYEEDLPSSLVSTQDWQNSKEIRHGTYKYLFQTSLSWVHLHLRCTNRYWDFPGGSDGKASACSVGDLGLIPGSGRSSGEGNGNPLWCSCPPPSPRQKGFNGTLEKEMATHSSTLAWRIPWREDPGRLQSMGLQRVGHDWATSLHSIDTD